MKFFISGTAGHIGSQVARAALEGGHAVVAADRNPTPKALRDEFGDKLETVYLDLTDRLALLRASEGCDAVIHLAAIPNPSAGQNDRLLHVNVVGTGYIFDAAEAHDINRVVIASSASISGLPFAKNPFDPQYLPMDEKHPLLAQDIYALSKLCNEETAATYTRRTGMTTVCLRPPMVNQLGGERTFWQNRWLGRSHEHRNPDLWSYLEVSDCARAFVLAAEIELTGHHRLLLAARDSWMRGDVREAVRRHFPQLEGFLGDIGPHDSLYDTSHAREVLGWQAEKSWRDVPELAEANEEKN